MESDGHGAATAGSGRRRRAPNRRGEGGRLRDEIVRAASEIVDETGTPTAVTLSAVARRVGIAAPSIYPHFRSPQTIVLAVVEQGFVVLRERLDAAVERAGSGPVDRLRALCEAYLHFAREQPRQYLLLFGGLWSAEQAVADSSVALDDFAGLGQSSMQRLTALLRDCVEAGSSRSTDPDADAVALWVGLHGYAHQRIVSPAMQWPDGIEDRLVRDLARLRDLDVTRREAAR